MQSIAYLNDHTLGGTSLALFVGLQATAPQQKHRIRFPISPNALARGAMIGEPAALAEPGARGHESRIMLTILIAASVVRE